MGSRSLALSLSDGEGEPTAHYTVCGTVRFQRGWGFGEGQAIRPRGLKYLASIDARPLDSHITFHISESFAMAGATDRALEVLEEEQRARASTQAVAGG